MSSIIRAFMLSAALVLTTTSPFAQTAPAAAASAANAGTTMPSDCRMRHDHGAEKGTPTPKSSAMCPDTPASAAKAKAKAPKTRVHDHGKFHKNQG